MTDDFEVIQSESFGGLDKGLIKSWTKGVPFDDNAKEQAKLVSQLPFIHSHVAVMPDAHWGMGACVGTVIATKGAIVPAAVGVDIGCGMMAVETSLDMNDISTGLYSKLRASIERTVPVGRTANGQRGDRGSWDSNVPASVCQVWNKKLAVPFKTICDKHPKILKTNNLNHLGTLGTGNHFIELCSDELGYVWVVLHSGSRGVGNKIGMYFIQKAKEDMERYFIHLPDKDLSYLVEGSENFDDYMEAVGWAQDFALLSRELMMDRILTAISPILPAFQHRVSVVSCHHNYVERENHFGANVLVTRKGAVRARVGDLGIIPGSMGERTFIVEGKGNPQSFNSCSHGAGRVLGRRQAERELSLDSVIESLKGVECRKDASIIDEAPAAYKDIDAVMAAQASLITIKHTLKQFVCVKG